MKRLCAQRPSEKVFAVFSDGLRGRRLRGVPSENTVTARPDV
ncbi:hypothetical protein [Neisseria dumasiana]|nr:hypothetical protein [Neisseria dumasiana]